MLGLRAPCSFPTPAGGQHVLTPSMLALLGAPGMRLSVCSFILQGTRFSTTGRLHNCTITIDCLISWEMPPNC